MVLARLGLQPLGFGVHTDLLTAVHFHFIALAALKNSAMWVCKQAML
jgi:hypothetical protein